MNLKFYSNLFLVPLAFVFLSSALLVSADNETNAQIMSDFLDQGKEIVLSKMKSLSVKYTYIQENHHFDDLGWQRLEVELKPLIRSDNVVTEKTSYGGIYYSYEVDSILRNASSVNEEDINNTSNNLVSRLSFTELFSPFFQVKKVVRYRDDGPTPAYWTISRKGGSEYSFKKVMYPSVINHLYHPLLDNNSRIRSLLSKYSGKLSYLSEIAALNDNRSIEFTLFFEQGYSPDNRRTQLKSVFMTDHPDKLISETEFHQSGSIRKHLSVTYDENLNPIQIKKFSSFGKRERDLTEASLIQAAGTTYVFNITEFKKDASLTEDDYDPYALMSDGDSVHDNILGTVYKVGVKGSEKSISKLELFKKSNIK